MATRNTRRKPSAASGGAAKGARRSTGVRAVRRKPKAGWSATESDGTASSAAREASTIAAPAAARAAASAPARAAAPAAPPAAPAPRAVPPPRAGPRPVVVARGDDAMRVFSETLKHSGFFEAIENAQLKSGKRRELFEVSCKIDFMRGVRVEPEPVSYVDPRLVTHLFNELLDRGFRILRVVEVRGELSRYLQNRSVKAVGRALGYDESCYELKDLADELAPVDLGPALGRRATGRFWRQADFRIVFAKNRTDELFGPALALWNVWHTLATPTDLVALEYGIDPGAFALAMLEKTPVQFALIDAIHSRDGSPGGVFPYDLIKPVEGSGAVEGAQAHRLGTVIAGADVLAVEAAGHKMQGGDPLVDPIALSTLRKTTGWKPPAEVEALPTFPGWRGVGARVRGLLSSEKPAEATRLGVLASLRQADARLFPPLASAWQTVRLEQRVEGVVEELRRRHASAVSAPVGPEPPDEDDGDENEPPTFL
jgi:hypothetical protein